MAKRDDDNGGMNELQEMLKKLEKMKPGERTAALNKSNDEARWAAKKAAQHENIFRIITVSLMLYVFAIVMNRPLEVWEWVPALLLFIILAAAISMTIRATAMIDTLLHRIAETMAMVIQIKARLDSAGGSAKELASVLAKAFGSNATIVGPDGISTVSPPSDVKKDGPSSGLEDFIK